ncbi:high mobility group nucleosome-binding domain-containing protein 5-like [Watersipora subatra]|uniref:high mobility group nucleosome-binding domain-containing protein 5-like n=1 Tax=Watersipora subatra TaxID=2589382 RepID=UPI00355B4B96
MHKKGQVIEELKQRLTTVKINRYEDEVELYQQNRLFTNNQKKVYEIIEKSEERMRSEGGRLKSVEVTIRIDEHGLSDYIKDVYKGYNKLAKALIKDNCEKLYSDEIKEQNEKDWSRKALHGQFLKLMKNYKKELFQDYKQTSEGKGAGREGKEGEERRKKERGKARGGKRERGKREKREERGKGGEEGREREKGRERERLR